jgi:hypothetical protein
MTVPGLDEKEQATAKAKAKQKQRRNTGISPLRRQSAPPSVEMTLGVAEREQATRKNNGKDKSWLGDGVHSHLSGDKTAAKMGHPHVFDWLKKGNNNGNSKEIAARRRLFFIAGGGRAMEERTPFALWPSAGGIILDEIRSSQSGLRRIDR